MTAQIHPTERENPDFLKCVFSAMQSVKNTGLTDNNSCCIAVYINYDNNTYGWTVREIKDITIGKTLKDMQDDYRVMAKITAKY